MRYLLAYLLISFALCLVYLLILIPPNDGD